MKHLYKIIEITDRYGNEKPDDYKRKERVFSIDIGNIKTDESAFLECVKPSWLKSVVTSDVECVLESPDGEYMILTTRNSVYTFEKLGAKPL